MEGTELEKHYTTRSGWLRAAVLGANDDPVYDEHSDRRGRRKFY